MNIALRDKKGNLNKGVIVGGVLTVGVVGFALYKIFGGRSKEDELLKKVIRDLDGSKMTISLADAESIANQLYVAMKDVGTDEKAIEDLLIKRTITSEDLKAIVAAFGNKKYNYYGSPAYDWMGGDDLDLKMWLYKECGTALWEKLKIKFDQAGFAGFGII